MEGRKEVNSTGCFTGDKATEEVKPKPADK
jgi:hypothetical protein